MTASRGAVASNRDELTESREQAGFRSAIDVRREATPTRILPGSTWRDRLAAGARVGLSNRAMNVLKILAAEMTGECPPRQRWTPSPAFLREITYKHLVTARNCGPQTINEIIRWAQSQGVTIRPPYHAGKSLADTWKAVSAKVRGRRSRPG